MSLIAFDPQGPQVGRLAVALAQGAATAGRALSDAATVVLGRAASAALRRARHFRLEISLIGGLGVALGLAYAVYSLDPPQPQEPVKPAPAPAWVEATKPLPMFAFDAPEFAKAASTYGLRRHTTGGGREDVLTAGAFVSNEPFIRIVVHQVGDEGAADQTLFVETARRAAEAGLALDGIGRTLPLPTKFGPAEWAEARVAAPGQATFREGCATFRLAGDKPAIRISGLVCGAGGAGFARKQTTCLIGRLDLATANEDSSLQRFFARSELARDEACPNPRVRTTAAPAAPPQKPALRTTAHR